MAKKTSAKKGAKKPAKQPAVGRAPRAAKTAKTAKTAKPARAAKATGPADRADRADRAGAAARIDAAIASLRDWRGERLAQIRRLIHEVDPDVVEEWKWMGTPVWSHAGMYVLANAHKEKVKVQFFHGAQLPDPRRLFNNGLDGGKWRAIDLRPQDALDVAGFKALLRAAIAYNEAHDVPKSRGSRA